MNKTKPKEFEIYHVKKEHAISELEMPKDYFLAIEGKKLVDVSVLDYYSTLKAELKDRIELADSVQNKLLDDIEFMKSENEKLREALQFYAKVLNYEYNHLESVNYVWNDLGKKAREALEEK